MPECDSALFLYLAHALVFVLLTFFSTSCWVDIHHMLARFFSYHKNHEKGMEKTEVCGLLSSIVFPR